MIQPRGEPVSPAYHAELMGLMRGGQRTRLRFDLGQSVQCTSNDVEDSVIEWRTRQKHLSDGFLTVYLLYG